MLRQTALIVFCLLALAATRPATPTSAPSLSVTIKNMAYSPATLTIKVGQTVTWTNADERDHTVVADDKSFKSDNISTKGVFRHTFARKGRFPYSCSYHPRMKGTIIVQ